MSRFGARFVILFTYFCLAGTLPINAPAQDVRWFRANKLDNRYEGLLDQPNAKREYDILGFFVDRPQNVERNGSSWLHAAYFVENRDAVYVQAKLIHSKSNYLMQSIEGKAPNDAGWNTFSWPETPVILTHDIDPKNLGVVVRLKSANEDTDELAPAFFYGTPGPLSSENKKHPLDPIQSYEFIFRVQLYSLADLSYRLQYQASNGKNKTQLCYYRPSSQPCASAPAKGRGGIEAGSVIRLPLDLTGGMKGDVTLHLEGRYLNHQEKLIATYHFYHQPRHE